MTESLPAVHVRVSGRVQGVGFRYFTQEKAEAQGLKGWVRNCPDHSVEAEASGPKEAIETWIEQLKQGPPLARVDHLAVAWTEKSFLAEGFRIE